jgi:multiple sugar transport system substrate-binding protein
MNRRIRALGSLALLALLTLSAVGAAQASTRTRAAEVTLTFGAWSDAPQMAILNEIVAAYEKLHPNVHIKTQFAAWNGYWQKVQTQLASGTPPDVGMMSVAYIGNFVNKGVVLNLDPYVQASHVDLSRYFPIDINTWRFAPGAHVGGSGPLYGMPYDASDNSTFFYNKTMFDKAHLAYPDASWTWDKVLEVAKKLTDPAKKQWGMIAPYTSDGSWTSLVWEWGGETIDPTYTKGVLSQPQALAALQYIYDLIYKYKVSPPPNPAATVDPFQSGQVGMYFSNCNCLIGTYKNIKDFKWDVANWPKGPRGRVAEMEPDGYTIFKATKHPDAAWDFLKFVIYEPGGTLRQATYGTIPALKQLAFSNAYLKSPGFPEHMRLPLDDDLRFGRSNYFGQGWIEWYTKSDEALMAAWLGKKTVAQAAKDADDAITKVLSQQGNALF